MLDQDMNESDSELQCQAHLGMNYVGFSAKQQQLICMKCVLDGGMKNSDVEDINVIGHRYRQSLKNLLRNLKDTTEARLSDQLQEVQNLQQQLANISYNILDEIQNFFCFLKQKIDDFRTDLVKQTRKNLSEKQLKLFNEENAIMKQIQKIHFISRETEKGDNNVSILKNFSQYMNFLRRSDIEINIIDNHQYLDVKVPEIEFSQIFSAIFRTISSDLEGSQSFVSNGQKQIQDQSNCLTQRNTSRANITSNHARINSLTPEKSSNLIDFHLTTANQLTDIENFKAQLLAAAVSVAVPQQTIINQLRLNSHSDSNNAFEPSQNDRQAYMNNITPIEHKLFRDIDEDTQSFQINQIPFNSQSSYQKSSEIEILPLCIQEEKKDKNHKQSNRTQSNKHYIEKKRNQSLFCGGPNDPPSKTALEINQTNHHNMEEFKTFDNQKKRNSMSQIPNYIQDSLQGQYDQIQAYMYQDIPQNKDLFDEQRYFETQQKQHLAEKFHLRLDTLQDEEQSQIECQPKKRHATVNDDLAYNDIYNQENSQDVLRNLYQRKMKEEIGISKRAGDEQISPPLINHHYNQEQKSAIANGSFLQTNEKTDFLITEESEPQNISTQNPLNSKVQSPNSCQNTSHNQRRNNDLKTRQESNQLTHPWKSPETIRNIFDHNSLKYGDDRSLIQDEKEFNYRQTRLPNKADDENATSETQVLGRIEMNRNFNNNVSNHQNNSNTNYSNNNQLKPPLNQGGASACTSKRNSISNNGSLNNFTKELSSQGSLSVNDLTTSSLTTFTQSNSLLNNLQEELNKENNSHYDISSVQKSWNNNDNEIQLFTHSQGTRVWQNLNNKVHSDKKHQHYQQIQQNENKEVSTSQTPPLIFQRKEVPALGNQSDRSSNSSTSGKGVQKLKNQFLDAVRFADESHENTEVSHKFYAIIGGEFISEQANKNTKVLGQVYDKDLKLVGEIGMPKNQFLEKFSSVYLQDTSELFVIGGQLKDGSLSKQVIQYNTVRNIWSDTEYSLKQSRTNASSIYIHSLKKIIIAGGQDQNGRVIDSCEFFDIQHSQSNYLNRMLLPRSDFSLIYNENDQSLYALGGMTGPNKTCLSSCEKLIIDRDNLSVREKTISEKDLDSYRNNNVQQSYKQGENTTRQERHSQIYWENFQTMISARAGISAALFKNQIYVFGGFDGVLMLNSVECYDFFLKKWSLVTIMSSPCCFTSIVHQNEDSAPLIFGGLTLGNEIIQQIRYYDEQTNDWNFVKKTQIKQIKPSIYFIA